MLISRVEGLKRLDRWLGSALVRLLPPPRLLSPPVSPRTILIIRPGGIGDAALLAPVIRILHDHCPGAVVDILAERRNAGVFDLVPGVGAVFLYDNPRHLARVLCRPYDLVIDTEQWHRLSAVVARLVRAPVKIGFATNGRRRMFTHAVAYRLDDDEASSFLRLLEPLAIRAAIPAPPWLQVPPPRRQEIAGLLPGNGGLPLIVVFPGASIPEKQWPEESFRAVAAWCCERRLRVAVVGGEGERGVGERIVDGLPGAVNLAGRTGLAGTAAVLERAAAVVSGDSGVLHIAAGLGRPTVALFGPSSPAKWAPKGEGHSILRCPDCPPCSSFGYTPACSRTPKCIEEIPVAEVLSALDCLQE